MIEILTSILMVTGTVFIVLSSVGLVRLPDLYTRMHAPTKAATFGMGFILLAALLFFLVEHKTTTVREVLAILFIFLTTPVSAHMLCKSGRARNVPFDRGTHIEPGVATQKKSE